MGAGAKNNVLHALSSGTPVVGTPFAFAGFDETPPGAISCRDEDELIDVLTSLIGRPERIQTLGAEARAYAHQHCTWEQSCHQLRTLLGRGRT
jgi:glycosyltransferase involved in cell wall biosynthesis